VKPWNWWSKVQARDVYAAPKRITALEALDGKKQLEVYAARVYAAEDEGGYIWLNLSMLSQDKATRVVRVPVGLLVDAHGQQNGDRRTDLAMPRRSASQRPLSGDLASSRPVGLPRQVPAGDGPYALTSSAPCPHRCSALRADRPTGPRCVIGGRRCTGTTAENHPVVWLDDPRRHIDGDYCPAVAGSRIRVANCESASQVGPTGRPYN
jgi:hypothetical protein